MDEQKVDDADDALRRMMMDCTSVFLSCCFSVGSLISSGSRYLLSILVVCVSLLSSAVATSPHRKWSESFWVSLTENWKEDSPVLVFRMRANLSLIAACHLWTWCIIHPMMWRSDRDMMCVYACLCSFICTSSCAAECMCSTSQFENN